MNKYLIKINWDKLGIGASLACAIHCAVVPIFFTSLPLFGINIVKNEAFEFFMIGLALVVGMVALRHGLTRHHHRILPVGLFISGIALLVAKEIVPGHPLWMVVSGAVLIVSAHIVNHLLCRRANHCHSSDCNH